MLQIPLFMSAVFGVRKMSLNNWPGFSSGGTLWFPDLTQAAVDWASMTVPMGLPGSILPLAVTLAYLGNIEMAFKTNRVATSGDNHAGANIYLF